MFSNSFKLMTLLGFDVKIDPSWLLIAALVVWSLSAGYFPQTLEGRTQATYLTLAVLGMIGLFASLILHELAHSVVARRYGVEIKGITLFIFGGIAELGREPDTAVSEFWIAIAGPIMSFALSGLFWFLAVVAGLGVLGPAAVVLLAYLGMINLVLALFNLVPAFPLDGGRVLRAYLWARSGNMLQATRRASQAGTIFSYVLIAMGGLSLFTGAQVSGLWQIFIGFFLLNAAKGTYQQQLVKAAFEHKTVAAMMTPSPVTASTELNLVELVDNIMLHHKTSFVPVVENGVLLGYIDNIVLRKVERENWPVTHVGDVFVPLDKANSVPPDMGADAVFEQMIRADRRKFLVAKDRILLGVITLADLMSYMEVLRLTGGNNGAGDAPTARG